MQGWLMEQRIELTYVSHQSWHISDILANIALFRETNNIGFLKKSASPFVFPMLPEKNQKKQISHSNKGCGRFTHSHIYNKLNFQIRHE
jgi:hypothetical protein